MATGTVRFWAAARAAAGQAEQAYDAATLGAVVAALEAEHGAALAKVLAQWALACMAYNLRKLLRVWEAGHWDGTLAHG